MSKRGRRKAKLNKETLKVREQAQRLRRFEKTRRNNTGTHRVCYKVKLDQPDRYGEWVYTDKEEAWKDAKRFVEMGYVESAWVESRELETKSDQPA